VPALTTVRIGGCICPARGTRAHSSQGVVTDERRWGLWEVRSRGMSTALHTWCVACFLVKVRSTWVDHLVRVVRLAVAQRQGVALERISFIAALRWLSTARPGDPLPLLVVHPHRPDRIEPHTVKRWPTPYPLLTKPRREARKALIQQSVGA
jgi:hypothetical protein